MNIKYLAFVFLLTGCGNWLRYRYDVALKNLPENSKVIDVNNNYITYISHTNIYNAHYREDGVIFKTELVK